MKIRWTSIAAIAIAVAAIAAALMEYFEESIVIALVGIVFAILSFHEN